METQPVLRCRVAPICPLHRLDSPEKIDEVSDYFNRRFNATGKSNLHGEKGIREMEADVVRGFENLVQDYATVQLLDGLHGMG